MLSKSQTEISDPQSPIQKANSYTDPTLSSQWPLLAWFLEHYLIESRHSGIWLWKEPQNTHRLELIEKRIERPSPMITGTLTGLLFF